MNMVRNCGNWNDEGWASIRTKGHSGPSGICMVWDVRGLLDPEYELTKGSEGNFIFKALHALLCIYIIVIIIFKYFLIFVAHLN